MGQLHCGTVALLVRLLILPPPEGRPRGDRRARLTWIWTARSTEYGVNVEVNANEPRKALNLRECL